MVVGGLFVGGGKKAKLQGTGMKKRENFYEYLAAVHNKVVTFFFKSLFR